MGKDLNKKWASRAFRYLRTADILTKELFMKNFNHHSKFRKYLRIFSK